MLTPVVGHPESLAEIERKLRDRGVQLLDIEFFWLRADTRVRDFVPFMEAGARLGAKYMLVGADDSDRNRLMDHWLELCDLAGTFQLIPSLEFMPISNIKSYAGAIDILMSARHSNAGVTIDSIHFDRSNSRVEEIVSSHPISYIQLCDAPAEQPDSLDEMRRQAKEDRLPPGSGGIDLVRLLRALPSNLPISVEVPLGGERRKLSQFEKAQLVYDATMKLLAKL